MAHKIYVDKDFILNIEVIGKIIYVSSNNDVLSAYKDTTDFMDNNTYLFRDLTYFHINEFKKHLSLEELLEYIPKKFISVGHIIDSYIRHVLYNYYIDYVNNVDHLYMRNMIHDIVDAARETTVGKTACMFEVDKNYDTLKYKFIKLPPGADAYSQN